MHRALRRRPPPPSDLYGQPLGERAAQQKLPQSQDTLWSTLQHTVITEDTKQGIYSANHPPEVKALVGKTLTIQGFILPYTTNTQIRHFLLTLAVYHQAIRRIGQGIFVYLMRLWNERMLLTGCVRQRLRC